MSRGQAERPERAAEPSHPAVRGGPRSPTPPEKPRERDGAGTLRRPPEPLRNSQVIELNSSSGAVYLLFCYFISTGSHSASFVARSVAQSTSRMSRGREDRVSVRVCVCECVCETLESTILPLVDGLLESASFMSLQIWGLFPCFQRGGHTHPLV